MIPILHAHNQEQVLGALSPDGIVRLKPGTRVTVEMLTDCGLAVAVLEWHSGTRYVAKAQVVALGVGPILRKGEL